MRTLYIRAFLELKIGWLGAMAAHKFRSSSQQIQALKENDLRRAGRGCVLCFHFGFRNVLVILGGFFPWLLPRWWLRSQTAKDVKECHGIEQKRWTGWNLSFVFNWSLDYLDCTSTCMFIACTWHFPILAKNPWFLKSEGWNWYIRFYPGLGNTTNMIIISWNGFKKIVAEAPRFSFMMRYSDSDTIKEHEAFHQYKFVTILLPII